MRIRKSTLNDRPTTASDFYRINPQWKAVVGRRAYLLIASRPGKVNHWRSHIGFKLYSWDRLQLLNLWTSSHLFQIITNGVRKEEIQATSREWEDVGTQGHNVNRLAIKRYARLPNVNLMKGLGSRKKTAAQAKGRGNTRRLSEGWS